MACVSSQPFLCHFSRGDHCYTTLSSHCSPQLNCSKASQLQFRSCVLPDSICLLLLCHGAMVVLMFGLPCVSLALLVYCAARFHVYFLMYCSVHTVVCLDSAALRKHELPALTGSVLKDICLELLSHNHFLLLVMVSLGTYKEDSYPTGVESMGRLGFASWPWLLLPHCQFLT